MQPPPPPGYAPGFTAGSVPGMPPQQPPGTNGLAIASLVLGIISIPLCFLFVPSVLAVVFGLIALNQIKANPGQGGRGQAIAGLIMGGVSLAFIVLAFVVAGSATWNVETVEVGFVLPI